jgi:hypothetical protein
MVVVVSPSMAPMESRAKFRDGGGNEEGGEEEQDRQQFLQLGNICKVAFF